MLKFSLAALLIPFLLQSCSSGAYQNFFNKKDLTGSSASNMQYWSVEDSAIVGKASEEVPRNQFLWSSVKVKDFYLSIDVHLDSSDRNAGIISTTEDINGEKEGYIALQIHSGPAQTVGYRIKELIHAPEIKLAGKNEKELNTILRNPLCPLRDRRQLI